MSEAGGRRFFQEPARRWLLLAAAPTLGSVGLEWATGLSSALSRAVTAVPLGAAAAVVVALALVPHRAPADRSATLP